MVYNTMCSKSKESGKTEIHVHFVLPKPLLKSHSHNVMSVVSDLNPQTEGVAEGSFLVFSFPDEVSSKLADAYQQELRLKQAITQEVAHSTEQDLAMVYLSAWLYQPYIEDSSRVLLESMLLETGHRPL